MLIQIHFSLGLAHANPDPFFTGLVSRPKQSPCLWCLQSHRPSDSSGGSYPQGLSSMHGVVASPCHLHCLDTIIQYIVVRLILREWHSPSAINWVFTQPSYPQLRTCKNSCVFSYFFRPRFFPWLHLFLLREAIGNVLAYLYTPIICLSKVSK